MAKPAYLINVLISEGDRLISRRLGAAWKTKKGNFRMQMLYYNTLPEDLIYLRDPEQEEPAAALAQHFRRRDQDNCTPLHRVFSAKNLSAGNVWFEKHGAIVQPAESNLMLLHVRTLPYPSASCSLYFAPIEKPEPANNVDADMPPFGEEYGELNANDFI